MTTKYRVVLTTGGRLQVITEKVMELKNSPRGVIRFDGRFFTFDKIDTKQRILYFDEVSLTEWAKPKGE